MRWNKTDIDRANRHPDPLKREIIKAILKSGHGDCPLCEYGGFWGTIGRDYNCASKFANLVARAVKRTERNADG